MLKYTDWQQLEGASWMASFHAEFFISIIFLTRFALLFVFLGLRGLKEEKRQKKKKKEHSMSGVFLD